MQPDSPIHTEQLSLLKRDLESLANRINTFVPSLKSQKKGYNLGNNFSRNRSRGLPSYLPRWAVRQRKYLRALPTFLAAMLWISMMAYFFVYYLTLPRLNGNLPRIGFSYATWPFISCVGAVRLGYFRGFCIAVSICNVTGFSLDLYLSRDIVPGKRWGVAKFCGSVTGAIFLIALSYESVNRSNRLHLIFTSIQILSTMFTKIFDRIQYYEMDYACGKNRWVLQSRLIKMHAVALAAPSSFLAIIGIYGCRDAEQVLTPGTACNILVAIAAPAEWILSGCWAMYMIAVSVDLYNAESIRAHCIGHVDYSESYLFDVMEDKNGIRSREVPLSPSLEEDEEELGLIGRLTSAGSEWNKMEHMKNTDTEYRSGRDSMQLDKMRSL